MYIYIFEIFYILKELYIYIYVYELVHNFVAWNITLVFGDIKKCFTEKLNDSEQGVIWGVIISFLKERGAIFVF